MQITKSINNGRNKNLSLKKSFDDAVIAHENDEFWTDCLDTNNLKQRHINNNSSYNTNIENNGLKNKVNKRKSNSVYVENSDLHLIKEIDEIKEETGKNTKQNKFEGYLTCKTYHI